MCVYVYVCVCMGVCLQADTAMNTHISIYHTEIHTLSLQTWWARSLLLPSKPMIVRVEG